MAGQSKIILTKKEILEKEFKIDTRGFRPQEVDAFLDLVMQDYGTFNSIIEELESEIKDLIEEDLSLKKEIRALNLKIEALKEAGSNGSEVHNADLLRRLSNLEKIIYGKKE